MPFLKQIVQIINDELKAKAFADKRFVGSKFYGIATSVIRPKGDNNSELLPCITDDFDNATYVGFDDKYPLAIYHKVNATPRKIDPSKSVGSDTRYIETAQMQMIVFADRFKIRLTPEEVDSLILVAFPGLFAKDKISPYKLISVRATNTGTGFRSSDIYNQEYRTGEYRLKPNSILIAISYQIEMHFNQSCLPICENCE